MSRVSPQKWRKGIIGDIDDKPFPTVIDTGNLYDTVIDADDQRKGKERKIMGNKRQEKETKHPSLSLVTTPASFPAFLIPRFYHNPWRPARDRHKNARIARRCAGKCTSFLQRLPGVSTDQIVLIKLTKNATFALI